MGAALLVHNIFSVPPNGPKGVRGQPSDAHLLLLARALEGGEGMLEQAAERLRGRMPVVSEGLAELAKALRASAGSFENREIVDAQVTSEAVSDNTREDARAAFIEDPGVAIGGSGLSRYDLESQGKTRLPKARRQPGTVLGQGAGKDREEKAPHLLADPK
eukprot:scaffold1307_cov200-Pinguiococcus_pyrenoidosus.AAC.17